MGNLTISRRKGISYLLLRKSDKIHVPKNTKISQKNNIITCLLEDSNAQAIAQFSVFGSVKQILTSSKEVSHFHMRELCPNKQSRN